MLNNKKGFTLIELSIAIVLTLIVLIVVSNIFALDQKLSRKSNAKAEIMQNGRITIDIMSREIRQAKKITTSLPTDKSNPDLVAHELEFEDGHTETQIQYIRYYLDGNLLKRQIIAYYFDSDPSTYVYWDSVDPFGAPQQIILEEKTLGEFFNQIDFYGADEINIDLILEKNNETVQLGTKIHPRNI